MIRFEGYRPSPPADYRAKGIAAAPDEIQYEGVIFSDGTVVLRWATEYRSHSVWASFGDFYQVHGHPEYDSRIKFLDSGAGDFGKRVSQDQNQYAKITDHYPVGNGSYWVCLICGHVIDPAKNQFRRGPLKAMIHPSANGSGDCPGSKTLLTKVQVREFEDYLEVSVPHDDAPLCWPKQEPVYEPERGQWVDCTEELRERLAGIDVDHMDLGTEILPAADEHDDSGRHMHLIDEDTQADLLRAALATLRAALVTPNGDQGSERAANADNWMREGE
jgi:hypothetical protein